MYIICFYDKVTKSNIWERIAGEDAMHNRVSELYSSGLDNGDILVFLESSEINMRPSPNERPKEDEEIEKICDILDTSLARAGYKLMDGGADWFIARNSHRNRDYEIKVTEQV